MKIITICIHNLMKIDIYMVFQHLEYLRKSLHYQRDQFLISKFHYYFNSKFQGFLYIYKLPKF